MTLEKKISRIFGLDGEKWLQHSNPWSVWTRFVILPLLTIAIWSRAWIGWLFMIPVGLLIIWTIINPLFFKKPKSTQSWASKCVLGEMTLINRDQIPIPLHHIKAKNRLTGVQLLGAFFWVFGLWKLDFWPTMLGLALVYLGKMWFLDRMVWLFEEMKEHREYKKYLY